MGELFKVIHFEAFVIDLYLIHSEQVIRLALLKQLPVATNYENDLTHRKPSATIGDILLTIDYWEKNICTKTERFSYISINIWQKTSPRNCDIQ